MPPQLVFTPVRLPRLPPPPRRRPASVAALSALTHLYAREAELRRAAWGRLGGGCGIILAVLAASLVSVAWWLSARTRLPPPTGRADPAAPVPLARASAAELAGTVLAIDAGLAALMLPVAVFTRKPSRADVAQRVLDQGCRGNGGGDPFTRVVLVVLAVGLLYGEFLIVDFVQSTWVAARLRGVDRHRAALVLATLRADPTGLDPRLLLRAGERPADLRRLIAYLILNEWADVSRHGDRLTLVSPARRRLRH